MIVYLFDQLVHGILKNITGISSFVGRLEDLEREMIVLMEYALEHVPENQYPYTPLYLKATAGMRLLPIQDQEDILATIRNVFRQYPFMFEDPWVEVISGFFLFFFFSCNLSLFHFFFFFKFPFPFLFFFPFLKKNFVSHD